MIQIPSQTHPNVCVFLISWAFLNSIKLTTKISLIWLGKRKFHRSQVGPRLKSGESFIWWRGVQKAFQVRAIPWPLQVLGTANWALWLWQTVPAVAFRRLFFCGTGVWTKGLILASQAVYHLSHSSGQHFFVLGIFEIGSLELFVWVGLELQFSWSLLLGYLGLQAWATSAWLAKLSWFLVSNLF
jgi:hypothetical protein